MFDSELLSRKSNRFPSLTVLVDPYARTCDRRKWKAQAAWSPRYCTNRSSPRCTYLKVIPAASQRRCFGPAPATRKNYKSFFSVRLHLSCIRFGRFISVAQILHPRWREHRFRDSYCDVQPFDALISRPVPRAQQSRQPQRSPTASWPHSTPRCSPHLSSLSTHSPLQPPPYATPSPSPSQ